MALKNLAFFYGEERIYKNVVHGFLIGLGGIVLGFIVALATIGSLLYKAPSTADLLIVFGILWAIIVGSALVANVHYRRSLMLLSEKMANSMLKTAGALMVAGAALTIVTIGVLLLQIAMALAVTGFVFSIYKYLKERTVKHLR